VISAANLARTHAAVRATAHLADRVATAIATADIALGHARVRATAQEALLARSLTTALFADAHTALSTAEVRVRAPACLATTLQGCATVAGPSEATTTEATAVAIEPTAAAIAVATESTATVKTTAAKVAAAKALCCHVTDDDKEETERRNCRRRHDLLGDLKL